MTGRTVGKYRVLEQIGRGGMGTVYKAVDETLDRTVAMKAMNADLLTDESVQRFRGEAVTLAKLSHPHIAAIHELTRDEHDLVMVMEFVRGETCERLLQQIGPFPVTRAVALCAQVLEALEHAHASGVVHRDLKPANIMVTPNGDVKVMDFGVARVVGSAHLTTDGFMMGTPAYMAPEQVRGDEVDPRMDLYAVAVVLYRLLTQHLPFEADQPVAMIHAQLHSAPTPPQQFRPDLPEWITAVLTHGLAKSPGDRFQSAAEFRRALESGMSGAFTEATPTAFRRAFDETVGPVPTPASMRASIPTPPAVPTPIANTGSTVMLQTRHVAFAGALLALLVIGVGVLAFAALRRTSIIVNPLATASQQETASAPPATASPAAAPPPASPVAPPVASAATHPSAPANVPASAPPPNTPPTRAPAPPQAVPSPAAVAAAAAKADEGSKADRADASAAKPAAARDNQSFGDVKALVADGSRSREQDVLLSLEPESIVVRNRDNGVVLKTLAYRSLAAATYSLSRKPRWSDQADVAAVPAAYSGSGFFLKTSKHWLALQSKSDFVVLHLDDRNVRTVLASIDARAPVKVQKVDDK